jgi:putative chitinase
VVDIADACGTPRAADAIARNWPLIYQALHDIGQGSVRSLAAAIATTAIETASTFEPVREAYWLSEAWRRANLRYYPYYGRGDIQLTWLSNYLAAEEEIPIPGLVANPDLALEPGNAARIFAWFWAGRNLQAYADREDWRELRRLVQGGADGLDRLITIVTRLLALAR